MRRRLDIVTSLTILVGSLVGAVLTSSAGDWQPLSLFIVLLVMASLSQLLCIKLGALWSSGSTPAYVLAMALLGPAPAMAIAVASLIPDALRRPPTREGLLGNVAAHAFFPLVGGLLIRYAAERTGLVPADAMFGLLVIGTYLVTNFLNWIQVAGSAHLRGSWNLGEAWREVFLPLLPVEVLTAFATAGTCYAYGQVGLPALVVLAAVTVTFQYMLRQLLRSQERIQELAKRSTDLSTAEIALREHAERIAALAEDRRRLVAQVLDAEERERRALADALHDEALQNVLSASHELEEAEAGDPEALRRARVAIDRTVVQLRDEVFELHPVALKYGGLEAALRAIAEQQARRAGLELTVETDAAAAGNDDQLLMSVARELLINATKHSGATELALRVARVGEKVVLEVRDNGRGFDPTKTRFAVRKGHIGLASISERVEAVGGNVSIDAAPGVGTGVVITIPYSQRLDGANRVHAQPSTLELGSA